jgi:hypothetical protein
MMATHLFLAFWTVILKNNLTSLFFLPQKVIYLPSLKLGRILVCFLFSVEEQVSYLVVLLSVVEHV